jgi:hypothetical protein
MLMAPAFAYDAVPVSGIVTYGSGCIDNQIIFDYAVCAAADKKTVVTDMYK